MAEIDTILDNQEVTAQTLNDIAIDLGCTSFNGFGENKLGADELNGITSALVSSGILSSDNKCEPYISDGKVYINTGTIVFASGAKKKITELVELDLITNSYIYALNDTAHNTCKIIVSETAPANEDFVNICEIAADGTLTDKRMIAKAKVELPTEGCSYVFTDMITYANAEEYDGKTITLPIAGATKIFINSSSPYLGLVYDIKTQEFTGCRNVDSDYKVTSGAENTYLYFSGGYYPEIITIGFVSQTETEVTFKYTTKNVSTERKMKLNYYIFGGIEND